MVACTRRSQTHVHVLCVQCHYQKFVFVEIEATMTIILNWRFDVAKHAYVRFVWFLCLPVFFFPVHNRREFYHFTWDGSSIFLCFLPARQPLVLSSLSRRFCTTTMFESLVLLSLSQNIISEMKLLTNIIRQWIFEYRQTRDILIKRSPFRSQWTNLSWQYQSSYGFQNWRLHWNFGNSSWYFV